MKKLISKFSFGKIFLKINLRNLKKKKKIFYLMQN